MNPKDDAAYYAYAAGWSLVRRMPEKLAYKSFEQISDRLWKKHGGGVRQLEKNLARVVPDASDAQLRELSKQSMRNYFRYWCDAFRMPDWSEQQIIDRFDCTDGDYLGDALAHGNGAIVPLAHMGNWDHTGAWGTLKYAPVTAIAEKLEPERLFERFVEYRATLGLRIYPLGQPHVIDTLAKELTDDNRIVALVSDRDLTARGIEVDFFGEKTRMPAGAANLALRTGAPIVPVTLWYDGPKACAKVHPPLVIPPGAPHGDDASKQPGYAEAVTNITQQLADVFAQGIAEHPTDWHMMQKLWLADLDQERLAASDAAARAADDLAGTDGATQNPGGR